MDLQVQPLKVLATRQVVTNRLDYSTYLNGTAKDELDRLDNLAGKFLITASKLTIEAHYKGNRLPADDWEYFKECLKDRLPRGLINFIEGKPHGYWRKEEFEIIEWKLEENGNRTWFLYDVDDLMKGLMEKRGDLEHEPGLVVQRDNFISDGWLVKAQKVYKMIDGKMKFFFYLKDSITTDKDGNVIRRYMWSIPYEDVKITKVMRALRVFDVKEKRVW